MTIDEQQNEHADAVDGGAKVHLFVPRSGRPGASRADPAATNHSGHEPTDNDDGPGPSAA